MRPAIWVAIAIAAPGTARAEPTGDADGLYAGELLPRPPIEWSSWIRVGYGVGSEVEHARTAALGAIVPERAVRGATWSSAIGADASLAASLHGDVRLGAWVELRGLEPFAGGELVVTRVPKRLDLFLYEGHGILAMRVGASATRVTATIAYGYLAPWKLEGPCRVRFFDIATGVCEPRPPSTTRYMVGVRLVATVTRAIDAPRDWSVTLGIETEPLGALRAMLAIRPWY